MSKEYVMCTYDSAGDLVPLEVRPTSMREAELELENLRLRSMLQELVDLMEDTRCGNYKPDSFTCQPAFEALSTPPSTQALAALVEKVEKLTIERCIDICDPEGYPNEDDKHMVHECRLAIRALPPGQLKLEDLL